MSLATHRIDFAAPSELFCTRSVSRHSRITYKRFGTAAEAIRFAVEELEPDVLRATTLEVAEVRLRGDEIGAAYASDRFPLARKSRPAKKVAKPARKVSA